jgi:hypothetical protein
MRGFRRLRSGGEKEQAAAKANAGVLPAPASKLAGDPVRCAQNDRGLGEGRRGGTRAASYG